MATIITSLLPISATLVLLLLLISPPTSIAVPMSRTLNLMDEGSSSVVAAAAGHQKDSSNIHWRRGKMEESSSGGSWENMESSSVMRGTILLQVNDYPGSGANNRHTPKP